MRSRITANKNETMPIIYYYRLSNAERAAIVAYLNGQATINATADKLGTTRQRVYTICAAVARHAAINRHMDAAEALQDF
jgi:transposase-like protein